MLAQQLLRHLNYAKNELRGNTTLYAMTHIREFLQTMQAVSGIHDGTHHDTPLANDQRSLMTQQQIQRIFNTEQQRTATDLINTICGHKLFTSYQNNTLRQPISYFVYCDELSAHNRSCLFLIADMPFDWINRAPDARSKACRFLSSVGSQQRKKRINS